MQLPTPGEINGDFSASAINGEFQGGIDSGSLFTAQALDGRPGCDATLPYSGGIAALPWYQTLTVQVQCISHGVQVSPGAQIPTACMDPVAMNLLQYLPSATNASSSTYQGVPTEADDQNQFTFRVDHKINDRQNLSIYYYFTDGTTHSPFYNFQASGANVPGYGTIVKHAFNSGTQAIHGRSAIRWLTNSALPIAGRPVTFQHPQNTGAHQVSAIGNRRPNHICFTGTSDSSVGPEVDSGATRSESKVRNLRPGCPPIELACRLWMLPGVSILGMVGKVNSRR